MKELIYKEKLRKKTVQLQTRKKLTKELNFTPKNERSWN